MSDVERDREEPKVFVYNSGQEDPPPEEPAAAGPARCPECGGRGSVLLLVTAGPCSRCGGTGVVGPAPARPVHTVTYTPDDAAPAEAELPARIMYSWYRYENDVLVAEERVDCAADGQWWREKYRVIDGELQRISREPAAPPDQPQRPGGARA